MADPQAGTPSAPAGTGRVRVAALAAAGVAVVVGVTAAVEATVVPYLPSAPGPQPSSMESSAPSTAPSTVPSPVPSTVPSPPSTVPSPLSPTAGGATPSAGPRSTTTVPAPPAPDPDGPTCSADGTRVVRGGQDAALGLRLDSVVLEVCGDDPVALDGYPRLVLLDDAGRVLDVVVEQGEAEGAGDLDPGPAPLLLDPGERAVAVLTWRGTVDPGSTDAGAEARTGAAVVVTPRPGDDPLPPLPMPVDLGTTGLLSVTAWQAAAPGG